jgi:phosphonate transport system ATP-binding protein
MIRAVGITKKLSNGKILLDNISFEVNKGEFVGILGPSGAGKTLTLKSLIGLLEITEGEVWIEQENNQYFNLFKANHKLLKKLRSKIALIFQGYHLVQRATALENVLMGRLGSISTWRSILWGFTDDEKKQAMLALESVNMQAFAKTKVNALSGGEKQRVAIARAQFQQPNLLLADEPISNLDPKNARNIMALLKELSDMFPVIGVFHQPDLCAKYCTRIIAIKDGKKFYDGKPDMNEALLEEIYGAELSSIIQVVN